MTLRLLIWYLISRMSLKGFFLCFRKIIGLVLLLMILSCSENSPEIAEIKSLAVLDFDDPYSPADVSFAVFAEVTGDVRRAERMVITHKEKQYKWTAVNPCVFSDGKKEFAAAVMLKAPFGERIPNGEYSVEYADAAGQTVCSDFSVSIDSDAYKMSFEAAQKAVENLDKSIAVFDSDSMIYFGSRKKKWATDENIFEEYPYSEFFRECYLLKDKNIAILMPLKVSSRNWF